MVIVVFQALQARAHPPGVPGSEYNYALASHGGVASASGSYQTNVPGRAIDGSTSTYWQSSSTTGWLSVAFSGWVSIKEVHAHFLSKVYGSLSVYLNLDDDTDFTDPGERVWTTTANTGLDVVANLPTSYSTIAMKLTIDAPNGNNKPKVAEFEAYLIPPDSDGDGLTDGEEARTVYFYESAAVGLPQAVPDLGSNNTTLTVNRLAGVPFRGLADFTVDSPLKDQLSATLSYWDGTGWVEAPVWDPGGWLTRPTILVPLAGAHVGGSVTITASIASPTLVTLVDFYVDGILKNTTSAPTSGTNYTWDIPTQTRNGWSAWDYLWYGVTAFFDQVLSWVHSAIVFVATLVEAFVQAIVQFGSWVAQAVSTAAAVVASAVQAAAKVLGQVVDALANAIMSVIHAALDPLINLVVSAYNAWAEGVAQLILSMRSLSVDDFVRGLIQVTFYSAFALAIFAVIVAFSVAEKITNAMTLGMANLAGFVIGAVAGLIIGMLVVAAVNQWLGSDVIGDLLPKGFDDVTGAGFTVAQFLFAYELAQRPLKPIRGIETGLKDAIIGLMLLGAASAIKLALGDTVAGLVILVTLDAFALYKELSGVNDVISITGKGANLVRMWYPFLYPVTVAVNAIGVATAATDLAGDAGRLASRL
ncbi:MAG TPA: Ig-like domain-containing protein [Thermoplasmata archaeon]|nr:Ig-like domain-containing protein [Thermoplasmata archaeon]